MSKILKDKMFYGVLFIYFFKMWFMLRAVSLISCEMRKGTITYLKTITAFTS